MENFDINALDIKTLRLLIAIADSGSVSLAAERRGMTQSTASYGLEKLRQAFGDPLFIRSGRGVIATEGGEKVVAACRESLTQLDALGALRQFDPGSAKRDFVFAATGYELETLLVPLRQVLEKEAPMTRMIVRALDLSKLVEKLATEWDLALMSEPPNVPFLKKALLFEDDYVTFYDPEVREAPKTLEAFCAAGHAVATLGGSPVSEVDRQLETLGRARHIALMVSHFEGLARLMRGTPYITTLAKGKAQGLMRDFDFTECVVSLPKVPIYAVWHVRKHADPSQMWLRQRLKQIARAKGDVISPSL